MPSFIDLTGRIFGKITVLGVAEKRGTKGYFWFTKCECGLEKIIRGQSLSNGRTTSCGCSEKNWCRTHGMEGTPTYNVWATMKQRCQNPNYSTHANYGGRGIKVCERWQKFEGFLADMGVKPEARTLDRIDNDGPYSPENCRWATAAQQAHNKRNTIRVDGRALAEIAHELGLRPKTLAERYRRGCRGADLFAKSLSGRTSRPLPN